MEHWLGADVRAVEGLPDHALEELRDVLTAAKDRQARALAAASDEAFRQMPPVVRGTVGQLLGH